MTQPVQEPSPRRTDSMLTWGQNQLYRRPAPAGDTGEIPWARRAQYDTSNQSVTDGVDVNVALNTFFTDFPDYYSAYDFGSADGITVETAGLHMITYRLFWSDWPNGHQITFNGIDPDAYAGYSFNHDTGYNATYSAAGGFTARLGVGQDIYMSVAHGFGSDCELDGFCGCFFEMQYLGFATRNYIGCALNPGS